MKNFRKTRALALMALALLGYVAVAPAQLNTNSNIKATKHNLSASGPGTTKATTEDQICVFCHTPHASNSTAPSPLWNRKIGGASADGNTYAATYTPYTSNSLDAEKIFGALSQPGGSSKLCLSCHDGTLALGTVGVLDGKANPATVTGLTGTMPTGLGATTGFTRNLGVDLRNDHPISFTFNKTLAAGDTDLAIIGDGELREPPYTVSDKLVVGTRSSGVKPMLPLDHEGKVQCTSCHDPHLEASKFLRLNRLQKAAPAGGDFVAANDQICLGCHNKLGSTWSNSAHANTTVAEEAYTSLAAGRREFPVGTRVWEAACLNCHDTHSVQGSRRLLREGVDTTSTGSDSGTYKDGSTSSPSGVSAIEETCYQCHQGTATKVIGTANGTVPNIKSEFERARRMPIKTADQGGSGNTTERHDISNADFIETPQQLGLGNNANRHVECTDCHNPHRVIRNSKFYGTNADANKDKRTHDLAGSEGNVASGVLRGTWGVEPTYGGMTTWPQAPGSYTVKKGDPGANTSTAKTSTYLTREYQLCFKCHSDYGSSMPSLGYTGGTPSGASANGMTTYTNVAAEFAVSASDTPSSGGDQGEQSNAGTACSAGDCDPNGTSPNGGGATGNNHRSWHPVIWPTGRDAAERTQNGTTMDNFRPPFRANLGTQTMHCSDCHGHAGSWTQGTSPTDTTNAPNLATAQGPHGSSANFILKGVWDLTVTPGSTRDSNTSGGICGRCHNPNANSGFDGSASEASHSFTTKSSRPCMRCHIAVPHGWKNKAFLVNLECVGPEGGRPAGCTAVGNNTTDGTSTSIETIAPYYNSAALRIRTWQASGRWTETSCGAPNYGGKDWMSDVSGCQ
ncbi:cytochrome c3 family protein [Aromatoleum diolicum]|uniref:Doubled CXXCH motif domain-containing protein n=1 Tax=Aromatoleum diolicum TaxID=75796 RepID=A0ABX1QF47_9RHOO|nr:cytochrome c3 family protein [Aromatoleum diolicum]NMG77047.1 hypothetical protein [Aromatoleum diolicum]